MLKIVSTLQTIYEWVYVGIAVISIMYLDLASNIHTLFQTRHYKQAK